MNFLETLKANAAAARKGIADEITRFNNKNFMHAVAAGCAIVSAADGTVSADEKAKMGKFIRSSEELKVFDVGDVIKSFTAAVEKFEFDHDVGTAEALRTIGKVKSDPAASRLLVRVCCAIGGADGDFDADEKAVVRKICQELGLPPDEFGV